MFDTKFVDIAAHSLSKMGHYVCYNEPSSQQMALHLNTAIQLNQNLGKRTYYG